MTRDVFIVARHRTDIYDSLRQEFAGDEHVDVVLDRRQGERRRAAGSITSERRRVERRRFVEALRLQSVGFTLVTIRTDL